MIREHDRAVLTTAVPTEDLEFMWCLTLKSENGYGYFQRLVEGDPGWAGRSVVRIPERA